MSDADLEEYTRLVDETIRQSNLVPGALFGQPVIGQCEWFVRRLDFWGYFDDSVLGRQPDRVAKMLELGRIIDRRVP